RLRAVLGSAVAIAAISGFGSVHDSGVRSLAIDTTGAHRAAHDGCPHPIDSLHTTTPAHSGADHGSRDHATRTSRWAHDSTHDQAHGCASGADTSVHHGQSRSLHR